MTQSLTLASLSDFPLVQPGDDLAALIPAALQAAKITLLDDDVLVLAQKIVSKAEGRYVRFADVTAGEQALALAEQADKDPRQMQLLLDESAEILRVRPGVVVVQHRLGYVHANAGIDRSNIEGAQEGALLLPLDSDASAAELRRRLGKQYGVDIKIIINDSAGRAWREGTCGMAIGTAGFEPLVDLIGQPDLFGRPLEVTQVAVADELAAAASFMMG